MYVKDNPPYTTSNTGLKTADIKSGANTGNKCLSCILVKNKKVIKNKKLEIKYSPFLIFFLYIIRAIRIIKIIDMTSPIQIVRLSAFQNPKSPQNENAFTDPYGYWPEEIENLSKINSNRFVLLLKGKKPVIKTSNPIIQ